MTTMTLAEAGKDFAGTLRRVRRTRMPVIIERRGKAVAVLTPPDAFEDYVLADEARGILAEMTRTGDKGISLAEFRKARGRLAHCLCNP